jgi:hypothetical protein
MEPGTAVIFIRAHGAIPIKQKPNVPFEDIVFIQKTYNILVSFITLSDIGEVCYGSPNAQKFINYFRKANKTRGDTPIDQFIIKQLTPQLVSSVKQQKELLSIIGSSSYPNMSPLTNTYLDKIYTKIDTDIISEGRTYSPDNTLEAILYSKNVSQVVDICKDLKEELLNNPSGIKRSDIINRCDSIGVRKLYIIDFSCNEFINIFQEEIHAVIKDYLVKTINAYGIRGGKKTKKRNKRYNTKSRNKKCKKK